MVLMIFILGVVLIWKRENDNIKVCCGNTKRHEYNYKVYKYIRANGGYEKWKYEILVEKEFENKNALLIKEKECINLLKPSLNSISSYQTKEERVKYIKEQDAKRLATKIECACGGKTSKLNKSTHEKTNRHQKYITNNITNNTYNITINN